MYSRTHALPAPSQVHALFYLFPSYLTLQYYRSTEVTTWFQEAATRLGHRLADTRLVIFSFGTGWHEFGDTYPEGGEGWEDIFGKKRLKSRKGLQRTSKGEGILLGLFDCSPCSCSV